MILGDTFPDFEAETTIGPIKFHEWLNNHWCIFFSHPADFTPVCTTELAEALKLHDEFTKRGFKVIAMSCDSVKSHHEWIKDIESLQFGTLRSDKSFPFPIIADDERKLAIKFGMLDPMELDGDGLPLTARTVFIIDGSAKLRLSLLYPATTGRNFAEILRVIDSLLLTEKHPQVATPVNWKANDSVMILPSVSREEADKKCSMIMQQTVTSGKMYMRSGMLRKDQ